MRRLGMAGRHSAEKKVKLGTWKLFGKNYNTTSAGRSIQFEFPLQRDYIFCITTFMPRNNETMYGKSYKAFWYAGLRP
jgi:hypothetical protein